MSADREPRAARQSEEQAARPHAPSDDDYVSRLNFAPPAPSLPLSLFSSHDAPSCKNLPSSIRKYRENGKIFHSSDVRVLIAFDAR